MTPAIIEAEMFPPPIMKCTQTSWWLCYFILFYLILQPLLFPPTMTSNPQPQLRHSITENIALHWNSCTSCWVLLSSELRVSGQVPHVFVLFFFPVLSIQLSPQDTALTLRLQLCVVSYVNISFHTRTQLCSTHLQRSVLKNFIFHILLQGYVDPWQDSDFYVDCFRII